MSFRRASSGLTRREFVGGSLAAGGTLAAGAARVPARTHAQEKRTIEVWVWETEDKWKALQETSGLSAQFPDVEFKWTALAGEVLHQKAITSLATGEADALPSIIRISNTFYRALVQTESLVDVTDQLAPHQQDILPAVWDEGVVDGKHYGVPDDTIVTLLGYRVDLFEAAGLPIEPDQVTELIKSYDDYLAVGQTVQEKTGAKLIDMVPNAQHFSGLVAQDTYGYFDQDANVIVDSDQHVACATIAKQLWDSGLVAQVEGGSPEMWQAYKDGTIATTFYPNYLDFVILDNAPENTGKWRVARLPSVQPGGKRTRYAPGLHLVVPSVKSEEERQLAVDVALFLKLNQAAGVAHMKNFPGAFVSYLPALQAMRDEPPVVLDGQQTYQVFTDILQEEQPPPAYRASVLQDFAEQTVNDALFQILQDGASIPETLKQAADTIRQEQENSDQK